MPDDQTRGLGHNQPPPFDPDKLAELEARMKELVDGANRAANDIGEITNENDAGRISAFVDQLREHAKVIEASRKAEKKIHDERAKAVQDAYRPLQARIDKAIDVVRALLLPWTKKLELAAAAERERKRQEAEAAAKAAEEAKRAAAEDQGGDVVGRAVVVEEAEQKAKEAEKAAKQAERQRVGVAPSVGGGRAKAIRRHKQVVIINRNLIPRKVLLLVDDEAILKALRANMDVASDCPGVEIKEVETVV